MNALSFIHADLRAPELAFRETDCEVHSITTMARVVKDGHRPG